MELARLGSCLSTFGALIWFLWPSDEWIIDPEAGFALASALVLWVFFEIQTWRSNNSDPDPSQILDASDIVIFERFSETMPPRQIEILRTGFPRRFRSDFYSKLSEYQEFSQQSVACYSIKHLEDEHSQFKKSLDECLELLFHSADESQPGIIDVRPEYYNLDELFPEETSKEEQIKRHQERLSVVSADMSSSPSKLYSIVRSLSPEIVAAKFQ